LTPALWQIVVEWELPAADLGLAIEPRDDYAAYIASWLE
jgi:hypothetical protein